MKQILTELTEFNAWANSTLSSCLQQLTLGQLDLRQPSSFDSVRKTAEHIADSEFNWLKRINGDSLWEFKASLLGNDLPAMLQFWLSQSGKFVTLVQESNEDRLKKILAYKNIKGQLFQNELYRIILHVMNHSTYHRGQLMTLLRGAGITTLPNTDLIGFFRL
jgi:uncharacterized damage-inducible protein DinB